MIRCHECGACLDSLDELARHECEPPRPKEIKRAPVFDIEQQEERNLRAWNDWEGK